MSRRTQRGGLLWERGPLARFLSDGGPAARAPRKGFFFAICLLIAAAHSLPAQELAPPAEPTVLIVVGAAGEPEYAENFARQAARWKEAAVRGGARAVVVGESPVEGEGDDLRLLRDALAAEPKEGTEPLWLVLIGHGTFDGRIAKFNLRGPDLAATDLALDLQPFRRPLAVVNAASASAPFMNLLAGENRVIVTATRSGYEQNYARFGHYLAEALDDSAADLDKDGQTSLLEAFLTASHRVNEFYQTEGRLATEHALIDDNGDGRGTPADWFRGVRATRKAADSAALDGSRAHQFHLVPSAAERRLSPEVRVRRDEIEREIFELREGRDRMLIDDYYRRLEEKFIELSRLYDTAESDS